MKFFTLTKNVFILAIIILSFSVVFNNNYVNAALVNPTVEPSCGLNIALVLDASGSIHTANALGQVQSAAKSFLNGIKDTQSKASLWWFGDKASELVPKLTSVTDESLGLDGWFDVGLNRYLNERPQALDSLIEQHYNGGDETLLSSYTPVSGLDRALTWTNWDDSFEQLNRISNDPLKKPDIVVFFTDGEPSAYNLDIPTDIGYSPVNTDDVAINLQGVSTVPLTRAIEQADLLKQKGIRIFGVGVGAVTTGNGVDLLKQVTGPNVSNLDTGDVLDLNNDDILITSSFSTLETAMHNLVTQLCKGSITINKKLNYPSGQVLGSKDWNFQVESSDISFATTSGSTDVNGQLTFNWDLPTSVKDVTIKLSENISNNSRWNFDKLECQDKVSNLALPTAIQSDGSYLINAKSDSIIICDAQNTYISTKGILVEKTASKVVVNALGAGEEVEYTYKVTNIGEVDLNKISIADDKCSEIYLEDLSDISTLLLKPNEAVLFKCKKNLKSDLTQVEKFELNVVSVAGTTPNGEVVEDSDTAKVKLLTPKIVVKKTSSKTSVNKNDEVTYYYELLNEGNSEISNVVINDDKCSPINQTDGDKDNNLKLGLDEVWHYQCRMKLTETTKNIVNVIGKDDLGNDVTTTDDLTVTVGLDSQVKGKTEINGTLPFTGSRALQVAAVGGIIFSIGALLVILYKRKLTF